VGIDATATGTGTISGISTDTVLFGESDGNAGVFEASGANATIEDLAFELTGFNKSGGTGLTLLANDGEISNVSLDTVLAANNSAGLNATATGSGVIEDLSFETAGFNKSDGTGLAFSAEDGTIRNVSLDTVTAGNNSVGIDATATGTGTISGISTDTVLFGESDTDAGVFEAVGTDAVIENLTFELTGFNKSGGTGLTLLADDGTVRNVSLDTVIASDNTVGANVTAAGTGLIRNVSANTVLFSGNEDGLRLGAVDDARIEDVRIERSGLNETKNALVFDGDGGTYSGVKVFESLIRDNTGAGVLITENTSTDGLRVQRSLIADNARGIVNQNETGVFDARNNWWGDSSGPSSASSGDTPYADPVNGKLAIGEGDSVSEGATPGVSNVRFDPAIGGKNRNEVDGQVIDPIAVAEDQNIDQIPQFSVEFAGQTIEGPVSDFVGLNIWERSVLPLRGDDADAANKIRNPEVVFRTEGGDISINRDFAKVYQSGESLNVTFEQTTGANTSRFAGTEVQFHVFRAGNTSSLSEALTTSINQTTGNVSVGSGAVEIVELRDLGEIDENGTVNVEFTPDQPGEYLFALTTVESGDGFELDDTGTGQLSANVLNDSTVFVGFEAITVQRTSSTVTPNKDRVLPGERIEYNAQANFEGDNINHAVLLFDKAAYAERLVVLDNATVDVSGNETRINGTTPDGLPLSGVIPGQFNQTAPADTARINVTGFVDGEPFLVSVNVTEDGCDPLNSTIPGSISDAEDDPCVNDITTSGAIEGVPFTVGVVQSGSSRETVSLEVPTGISFENGNKTFQWVHAAVSGDNTQNRSTDVGTITVQQPEPEPEPEVVVDPANLDFGTEFVNSSTTETVTVTNNGSVPLNLTSIGISGQDANEFRVVGTGPTALAPGDSTTIDVAFEPATTGIKTATLEIPTNESASATSVVGLNGTAVALEVEEGRLNETFARFVIRNLRGNQTVNLSTAGLGDADVAFENIIIRTADNISTISGASVSLEQSTTRFNPAPELPVVGDVARYLNVTPVGITDDDIESVDFQFRLSESRLGGSDPEDVVFYRFNNGSWDTVSTTFVGTASNGDRRFVAQAPGLSVFAVLINKPEFNITDTGFNPETVSVNETALADVTVENIGTADGEFTAQLTANGDPVATRSATISAGGSKTILFQVSFADPGKYDLAINGTNVGTLTVQAPSIAVDPNQIDFGEVNVGSTATESVTVANEGNATLNISSVGISGADAGVFSVVSEGSDTVAPGEETTIEVEFAPDSAGDFSAQLDIGSSDTDESVDLSGTGEARAPSIAVTPDQIDFGEVNVGSTVTESVTVANEGNATLNISSVGISGPDTGAFSVVSEGSDTVAPGEETTIEVEFAPGSEGDFSAQLDIGSNDTDESVDLSGTGEAAVRTPSIAVDPDQIDFGEVNVNDTATESVTVTNEGNATLAISSVGISGADAGAFSVVSEGSDTVAPGETTTIEVEFAPDSAGDFSAQLDIESNDTDETVDLSGTAPEELPEPPVGIITLVTLFLVVAILLAVYFRGTPEVTDVGNGPGEL
ncbi:MAG: choice-of-anchor D domain-containing protein, partial [Halobacteriales archaeon]